MCTVDKKVAFVHLPRELFGTNTLGNKFSRVGTTFAIFKLPHFFPVRNPTNSTLTSKVGSVVIAATVGSGISIKNLNTPVTIKLARQIQNLGFVSKIIVIPSVTSSSIWLLGHKWFLHMLVLVYDLVWMYT